MNSASVQTNRLEMRELVVLSVLISLFFTFMLGNRPLSVPDEGRYVEIPREMAATGDYLTPRLNGVKYFEKPVLFYWLEALSIRVFGLNEFTLRLWPAIFALIGCLAVAVAGARLFGRRSGVIAAVVLATSVLYYGISRTIILDMPVSILLTLCLLSFLIGTHAAHGIRRRLYFWAFYACMALAALTKGLIGIVIPLMVIGSWIILLGEWRLLKTVHLPSGIALFLLIAAPWHIMVSLANPEFFRFYFIQEHFLRYLTKMHGRYRPAWYFIPVLIAGLLPWSVFLVQSIRHNLPASWKERHEHRDAIFLMLWAVVVFAFFSASSSKLMPYILPVFPPLSLLIGRYLAASWDRQDFPGVRIGFLVLAAASLLLSAAFFVLPSLRSSPDMLILGHYRILAASILACGALAVLIAVRYRGFRTAFFAVAVMFGLFLLAMNAAAPRIDRKSVKQIAIALKPRLKPGDHVASYATYYQDLPVYLERQVLVVDWKGELEFGTTVENTGQWIMDSPEFWRRWEGPETVYMLTRNETYENLRRSQPRQNLFLVARDDRNILVANKEVVP